MSRPRYQRTTGRAGLVSVALAAAAMTLASCAGTKPDIYSSARESYDAADELFARHKWEKAQRRYEAVIFNFPGSSLVDSAQYQLARCYFKQREYDLAALEFLRIRNQYRNSELVDDADLQRIVCLMRGAPKNTGLAQERIAQTVAELNVFRDSHPISTLIPVTDSLLEVCQGRLSKKDFDIGKLYHRMNRFAAAEVYLQGMIDTYPSSPLVAEALLLIGEGKFKLDSLDRAKEYYEKVLYLYPESEATGKAGKRLKKIERLSRLRDASEPDSMAGREG